VRLYERRLPHWDALGQPVFVTFRLHGSLPESRVFPPEDMSHGQTFVVMDRLLDFAQTGPLYLKETEVVQIVVNAIQDGQMKFGRYQLHAYVAMPNHVHLLVTPRVPNAEWLGPLKGFTGAMANRALGRNGAFWQDESYDHLVRDAREFARIKAYIECNPVRACLAVRPEELAWSSASARLKSRAESAG
jgi:putative transposase